MTTIPSTISGMPAQGGAALTGAPDPAVFAANLSALSRRNPYLADLLMQTMPAPGVVFSQGEDGGVSVEHQGRLLASRRRPLDEAATLARTMNAHDAGCAVVLGFGAGHHVAALANDLNGLGVVAVFEPDVGLLRAVLERIDHSAWLAMGTTAIFTDAGDVGAVAFGIQGWEAPLGIGVQIIEHAPSRARLGDDGPRFSETFSKVVGTVRTHIVTTMVQTDVTVRNALMNADDYVRWPGVGELRGVALGGPAVVVSAGPSLARNIALLRDPSVRERCVIVAVQTVLKQLLAEGIRPHFVCALDYHEISRRFYEGLTAADVEGVTLIVEPKANPAILKAWPGAVRMTADGFLEEMLGAEWAGRHEAIKPGATVAHLAYYLARHLGADPVVMVGQDLAFTDGQYYGRDAAIHATWACELNAFNTLEMMEWQRIVRMRGNLHEATDHLGRRVYTDDQMLAYLHQFERDFMDDSARGLTIVDATEGGVRKAHTSVMPLEEAIVLYVRHARTLAPMLPVSRGDLPPRLGERLRSLRADVRTIARLSRETRDMLGRLAGRLEDEWKANAVIRQIHANRDRVETIQPAYSLVHRLNQTGTFKRFKADRAIKLEKSLSTAEVQRRRVERDSMNVGWLADSADVLEDLLNVAAGALEGGEKRTRDVLPRNDESPEVGGVGASALSVGAVVVVGAGLSAWGASVRGQPALRGMLERLAAVKGLGRVTIVTDDEGAVRTAIGAPVLGLNISFRHADLTETRRRRRSVDIARAWAGHCWRGGIAGLTAYDEAFDPALCERVMEEEGLDAALVVGGDWALLDPALTSSVVERFRESAAAYPIAFTQAPPGLCGCVLARSLVTDLATAQRENSPLGSIGGVLGYRPLNARSDLIAQVCCVPVPMGVRDAARRFIPDHARFAEIEAAWDERGTSSESLCASLGKDERDAGRSAPLEVVLRLGPGGAADAVIDRVIDGAARGGVALTVASVRGTDVIDHPAFERFLERARTAGVRALHVRTMLTCGADRLAAVLPLILESAGVVSVDCVAGTAMTYLGLTGRDVHPVVLENADALLRARAPAGGLWTPWIVPRITRRDAVYEEIEGFFDKSVVVAGWGVIDALDEPVPGDRIAPLPKPALTARRDAFARMLVNADGAVVVDERTGPAAANVLEHGFDGAWARLVEARARAMGSGGPTPWTGW